LAQAGPAHGCILESTIPGEFFHVEKKANNTVIPGNMSKTFKALCAPHRLHTGKPKIGL